MGYYGENYVGYDGSNDVGHDSYNYVGYDDYNDVSYDGYDNVGNNGYNNILYIMSRLFIWIFNKKNPKLSRKYVFRSILICFSLQISIYV